MKAPVFLSASLPDSRRHARYYRDADLVGIREAVRALVEVVLPRTKLVFGGHPAVTPLVRLMVQALGLPDRVRIYQSAFFQGAMPDDVKAFPDLVVTKAVANDLDKSLLHMRKKMIGSETFGAGVFIGGMEGVEAECALFEKRHPNALVLPIASVGGAGRILFEQGKGPTGLAVRKALRDDTVFGALFLRLLGVEGRRGR